MRLACSTCDRTDLSIDDFYIRKSGPRAGQRYDRCKECFKARGRTYYRTNREKQYPLLQKRTATYAARNLALLILLKSRPCADCNRRFEPWQMDFDHCDGKTKVGDVSSLFAKNRASFSKVIEEVRKCDLVCAACHRTRTKARRWNATFEAAVKYLDANRRELVDLLQHHGFPVG